jgi:signal transduction histidine kinase
MNSAVPDSKRVFQTAAWMWLTYQTSLAVIDGYIYANRPGEPVLWYHMIHAIPALLFLALSYSRWLDRQVRVLAPLMILLITAAPILLNRLVDFRLPPAPLSNVEGMVLRLLPVLLIGLVLAAWHYSLGVMVLYVLGTNLLDAGLALIIGALEDSRLASFFFIVLIRMVCFLVVGIFINQLIGTLRKQQDSLRQANAHLANYAQTLESLTVSRERNRMSRELHDTVVHTLSGLSVQLETAKAYWGVDGETARHLLDQSLETTRAGLQETRRALKALRASPLDDLGLAAALDQLCDSAAQRGKMRLEKALPGANRTLPPEVEECVYRVAQEALENAVRHAGAKQVKVALEIDGDPIRLVIEDDGQGFDLNVGAHSGHFGLQGMRERALLAGGDLHILSQPGDGARVELTLPGRPR